MSHLESPQHDRDKDENIEAQSKSLDDNYKNNSNGSNDKKLANRSELEENENINADENRRRGFTTDGKLNPITNDEGNTEELNAKKNESDTGNNPGLPLQVIDNVVFDEDVEKKVLLKAKDDVSNANLKKGDYRKETEDLDIPIDRGWAWAVVCGVVGNMLSAKLSCRCVVFIGGILGCFGFFLTAFMSEIVGVVFTFGVVGGIAFSLCYSPCVVMVGQHFRKYRSLANGISVAGSGVGTFIIPNLMRVLLREYGLPGCLMIFSGIVLNLSAVAMLFRPWSSYRKRGRRGMSGSHNARNLNGDHAEKLKTFEITNDKVEHLCKFDKENGDSDCEMVKLVSHGEGDFDNNQTKKVEEEAAEDKTKCDEIREMSMMTSGNTEFEIEGLVIVRKNTKLFDWTLLFHPVFFIYALANTLATPGYAHVFVMLPDYAEMNGHDRDTSALITSIIGVSDLAGRLLFGWFSDLNIIPKRWGFIGCMACSAVLNFILPSLTSFPGLVCYAVVFGFFSGSFITLAPVLLAEDLGTERLGSSFGLTNLFMATAIFSGPPICGSLKDLTGSWDTAFYLVGFLTMVGALLPVFQPCGQRWVEGRERRKKNSVIVQD